MTSRLAPLFALLVAAATAPACADETIVLATIPLADGGAPPEAPVRCVTNADCADGSFCAKQACAAAAGTCERFPIVCPDDEAPVCGCDHITYFNDCLRRAAGVEAAGAGECTTGALRCGGEANVACPEGASCARLLGGRGPCPPDLHGACWVLPARCPGASGPDRWDRCGPGARCVDTCAAIRTGLPFRRTFQCAEQ